MPIVIINPRTVSLKSLQLGVSTSFWQKKRVRRAGKNWLPPGAQFLQKCAPGGKSTRSMRKIWKILKRDRISKAGCRQVVQKKAVQMRQERRMQKNLKTILQRRPRRLMIQLTNHLIKINLTMTMTLTMTMIWLTLGLMKGKVPRKLKGKRKLKKV